MRRQTAAQKRKQEGLAGIMKGTVAVGLQGRPLKNTLLAFVGVAMMGKQRNAELDELIGPVQHRLGQLLRMLNQE